MTGDSDQMHHERAVAAIADAYHATRSDQRGSNLYNGMGLLIMREPQWRLVESGGRNNLLVEKM
jgi:hypothetical protein